MSGVEKIRNKELKFFYSFPRVIRISKSRRVKRAGRVACMGEKFS
jgi:hypothetical protein